MREVTQKWIDNQATDAADPSCVRGFIETRKINTPDADTVTRWAFNNDDSGDNVFEVELVADFDPSRSTLPYETCKVTLENGSFAGEPSDTYDFTLDTTQGDLEAPGIIELELGYYYSDPPSFDSKMMTKQRLAKPSVTSDELYAVFEGESFTSRLGETTFYKGRYAAGGIDALTLLTEILEDAEFPNEGGWHYRLGHPDCKVSAVGANPLWTETSYEFYHLDPALANVTVHMPVPPMTHREAVMAVCAYVGADAYYGSDGSLYIWMTRPDRIDYHINDKQVYDRAEIEKGVEIGTVRGFLYSYTAAASAEQLVTQNLWADGVGVVQRFVVTHDAAQDCTITATGATINSIAFNGTYAIIIDAVTTNGSHAFSVTVSGKPVTIGKSRFDKFYTQNRGELREFDNPIASDAALTYAMYDHYRDSVAQRVYKFKMRDDPAIEARDRIYFTPETDEEIPVIVQTIKRNFNGGIEAEYTVVSD